MFFILPKLSPRSAFGVVILFVFALLSTNVTAQTKKPAVKPAVKPVTKAKTTAKTPAKSSSAASKKETAKSKTQTKNSKPTKAELAAAADKKRIEAERTAAAKKAAEAKRQAALAEQRRREQAAREARERQMAFERGLKSETRENIANDNTEGEDLEVRKAAINALGNHAGTVVVMEPDTGKVLTIVNQEWAIRRGFKPCSTIKLVTGVAGLNEKVINEAGSLQNKRFSMNLDDALAHSNNSYFQVAGSDLGNERLISYARALGLGEKTGINAPDESAGKLPYRNNNARIYSHGDDFEVTALQLGVMVSAVSNGGKIVVPQIPVARSEKASFQGFMRSETSIPNPTLQRVLPGMIGAVNYGTARRAADDSMNIAGKTGSCIGQGSWLGLFASVAPVVNPKYAVIVITRGQDERGKYASAIAGKIYQSLKYRIHDSKEFSNKLPLALKPQQKIDARTSQKLDTSAGDDADEGDTAKPPPAKNPAVKVVTHQKKDIFEPVVIEVNREPTRPRIVQVKPNQK